jgi:arginyl-tRNA synthetase
MNIIQHIQAQVSRAVAEHYHAEVLPETVLVNATPPEFTGQYSVVVFPFVKLAGKAPDAVANDIGAFVQAQLPAVKAFNVVKGFLNIEVDAAYWHAFLQEVLHNPGFGRSHRARHHYHHPPPRFSRRRERGDHKQAFRSAQGATEGRSAAPHLCA